MRRSIASAPGITSTADLLRCGGAPTWEVEVGRADEDTRHRRGEAGAIERRLLLLAAGRGLGGCRGGTGGGASLRPCGHQGRRAEHHWRGSREPPDGGEREERFASVERGDAVLRRGGRRRQNAYRVCAVSWWLIFDAKVLYVAHFCFCLALLKVVLWVQSTIGQAPKPLRITFHGMEIWSL